MSPSLFKLAMEGDAIRGQEVEVLQTDAMVATQKLRGRRWDIL
jgi:hypothetical protein